MAFAGTLEIMSAEGDIFKVDSRAASMSMLIKGIVDDDAGGIDEEIPLPNVKSAIFCKVIEYCMFHKDQPVSIIDRPLKSANLTECGVSAWDCKYIDSVEQEVVFELIAAANFLDIQGLLDLGVAKIASMIKGRTVEEIRTTFNITSDDLTPEEEAQIQEETRWCNEGEGNQISSKGNQISSKGGLHPSHEHAIYETTMVTAWVCDVCHKHNPVCPRYRCTSGCHWDCCAECWAKHSRSWQPTTANSSHQQPAGASSSSSSSSWQPAVASSSSSGGTGGGVWQ